MYCHSWLRLRNVVAFRTRAPTRLAPIKVPMKVPRPPSRLVPPRTTAVIDVSVYRRGPGSLTRITDSELREQDDRTEEREQRGADIAEERGAVHRDADTAGRLLRRPDRAKPQT